MKEPAGTATSEDRAVLNLNVTLGQIPVRHVARRVADDTHILEEDWREIQPTLVVVHAVGDGVAAVSVQPIAPPLQKLTCGWRIRHADEAAVVDAGLEDVQLAARRASDLPAGQAGGA